MLLADLNRWDRGRVFDADTGEDLSRRVPISAVARLRRSFLDQQPRKIAMFCLNDQGQLFVAGGQVASEVTVVQVVLVEVGVDRPHPSAVADQPPPAFNQAPEAVPSSGLRGPASEGN